jgi:HEAT repeat protein
VTRDLVHFCPHCWREHPAASTTCPSCGAQLAKRLPYREALELALACPEATTARRAAYLLGEIRDSASIPALTRAVETGDPYVAAEAIQSLAKIGGPEAMRVVVAARDHRYVTVRASARNAYQANGPNRSTKGA